MASSGEEERRRLAFLPFRSEDRVLGDYGWNQLDLKVDEDVDIDAATASFVEGHLDLESLPEKLDALRVASCPREGDGPNLQRWLRSASARDLADLHLDLSTKTSESEPSTYVFKLESDDQGGYVASRLLRLSLRGCRISQFPSSYHLSSLERLYIDRVKLDATGLTHLLASTPLLSVLDIRHSSPVVFSGEQLPQLTALTIVDCGHAEITTALSPKLRTINICTASTNGIGLWGSSQLRDAYLSCCTVDMAPQRGRHLQYRLLSAIEHVRVLTLGGNLLELIANIKADGPDPDMWVFNILVEWQLLIPYNNLVDVFYTFFNNPSLHFPVLERIFIELDGDGPTRVETAPKRDIAGSLPKLAVVKMNNYFGSPKELRLVVSILERATDLQSIILVMHPSGTANAHCAIHLRNSRMLDKLIPASKSGLVKLHAHDTGEVYSMHSKQGEPQIYHISS